MPLPITHEEKIRLTHQMFSLYAQYGFDGISMDEVSRRIKISKATLYKYFKSKEDIVRDMVDETIAHMDSLQFTTNYGIGGILESVSAIYFKSILIVAYSSSVFLSDLQNKFPDLYSNFIISVKSAQDRFSEFYDRAVQGGYFKQLPIHLVGEQFKNTLPVIINSGYLSKHNMELLDAIVEYYKLLLYQILNVEYQYVTDQDSIYFFINNLVDILKMYFY